MPLAPFDPSRTYYVIVGRGFSAVLHHSLLPAARRGDLPILHIGRPDPWSTYYPHRMGQWPCLLTPPGFESPAAATDEAGFLQAEKFARATQLRWEQLLAASDIAVVEEPVRAISAGPAGYEIQTSGGARIMAARIDICGGPGPPRRKTATIDSTAMRKEYAPGGAPHRCGWRRVIAGEEFLEASTAVAGGRRVLVYGDGPTAAWCVERALRQNCSVRWAGRDLRNAFVSSGRNDWLAHPVRRERCNGRLVIRSKILPAAGLNLTCAEGDDLWRIEESPITLLPVAEFDPDGARHEAEQVVIAIGQNTDLGEDGSWAELLHRWIRPGGFLIDEAGRKLGLCSADQSLRCSAQRPCAIRFCDGSCPTPTSRCISIS